MLRLGYLHLAEQNQGMELTRFLRAVVSFYFP